MPSRSATTIEDSLLPPLHPGEILSEEFLLPLHLSQYRLAHDLGVPPRRVNQIVHGTRGVTADTALRLARYFGTTAQFWLNLQARYELEVAERMSGRQIRETVVPRSPA